MAVDYRSKYKRLKGKLKYLVYEQECFLEEMRRTQKKLIRVSRDKSFLLDRLLKYEAVPPSSSDDEATASSSNESEEEALKLSTPLKSRTKRQRPDQAEDAPPPKQMSFSPAEIKLNRSEENARAQSSENGPFEVNCKPSAASESPVTPRRGLNSSSTNTAVATGMPSGGSPGQPSMNKTVPPAAAAARMASSLLSSHARPQILHGKSPGKAGGGPKSSVGSTSRSSEVSGQRENHDEEQTRPAADHHSPAPAHHKTSAGKSGSTSSPGLSSVCKYLENGKQCTEPVNMKSKSPFCTYHRSVIRKKSVAQPARLTLPPSQMPSGSASSSPYSSLSSSSSAVTPPVPPLSSTGSSQPTPDNDLHR